jgi:hypothetical protein
MHPHGNKQPFGHLLHSSLDVAHALIIILCSNDLTLQGGCEGDVEQ